MNAKVSYPEGQVAGRPLRFTGFLVYPRAHRPDGVEFFLFIGPADRPRLPSRETVFAYGEVSPGRAKVTTQTPLPEANWRSEVCVDYAGQGPYGIPGEDCEGATRPNPAYRDDAATDRAKRRERAAGG